AWAPCAPRRRTAQVADGSCCEQTRTPPIQGRMDTVQVRHPTKTVFHAFVAANGYRRGDRSPLVERQGARATATEFGDSAADPVGPDAPASWGFSRHRDIPGRCSKSTLDPPASIA